ncbi:MAG TPA: YdcF family protein, partial [Nannocystis sp.]
MRHVPTFIKRAAALALAWALVHLLAVCLDGCSDDDVPADVAVVLGNHVSPAGEPARRLQLRLDRALDLYRAGLVPRIIVSGGRDPGSPYEADVMKRYLAERGVPEDHIIADRGGVNTHATARFVAAYLREHGLRSAVAVSQYYHISR